MYESAFSYNLTRPYPYRWFTWVVVLGGIAATALFSVVSVAANGFDTTIVYVANPNDTEHPSQPAWYQKRPWSLASKIVPTCQDQTLSVGSTILSNNLYFPYEIQAINKKYPDENKQVASFTYHNDHWRDCWVDELLIDTTPMSIFAGMNASITINCTVFDHQVPTTVYLKTTYQFTDIDDVTGYPLLGNGSRSSLAWGKALLEFQAQSYGLYQTRSPRAATYSLYQDIPANTSYYTSIEVKSREDLNKAFWSAWGTLSSWSSTFGSGILPSYVENYSNNSYAPSSRNISDPDIAAAVFIDYMAKIMYSCVLTDLGQDDDSNFLASPQGIWNYFNAGSQTHSTDPDWIDRLFSFSQTPSTYLFDDPANQDPATLFRWANVSLPYVNNSYINTEYLCQVPKQKSTGSLIFSVIVADLVFLQVLWTMFTWIVKRVVERRDLTANCCHRCVKPIKEHDEIEQNSVRTKNNDKSPHSCASQSQSMEVVSPPIRRRPVPVGDTSAAHGQDETTAHLLTSQQGWDV